MLKRGEKYKNLKCPTCVTGKLHIENIERKDRKEISRQEFLSKCQQIGETCLPCIHNPIGKRKGKVYKKIAPNFKTIDNYIQKE